MSHRDTIERTLEAHTAGLTAAQIARHTGLSRSIVRRALDDLRRQLTAVEVARDGRTVFYAHWKNVARSVSLCDPTPWWPEVTS